MNKSLALSHYPALSLAVLMTLVATGCGSMSRRD